MRNEYGALVEPWKVNLVLERARAKGFKACDLDDVQQEVVLAIWRFRFDPQKANGASERTALSALIDKRLMFLRRGRARARKHATAFRRHYPVPRNEGALDYAQEDRERSIACSLDVKELTAQWPAEERAVCAELAKGLSRRLVARKLGITRLRLDRIIRNVADNFIENGLNKWVP